MVADSEKATVSPEGGARGQLTTAVSSCLRCVPRSASLHPSSPIVGANDESLTKHDSVNNVFDGSRIEAYNDRRYHLLDRSHMHRKSTSAFLETPPEYGDDSTGRRYSSNTLGLHRVDGGGGGSIRDNLPARVALIEVSSREASDPADSENIRGGGVGATVATGVVAALVGAALSSVASYAEKLIPGRWGRDGGDHNDVGAFVGDEDGDRDVALFKKVPKRWSTGGETARSPTGSAVGGSECSHRGLAWQSGCTGQHHRLRGSERGNAWIDETASANRNRSPSVDESAHQSMAPPRYSPYKEETTTQHVLHDVEFLRHRVSEYPFPEESQTMAVGQTKNPGASGGKAAVYRDTVIGGMLKRDDLDLSSVGGKVEGGAAVPFFGTSSPYLENEAAFVHAWRDLQVRLTPRD